MLSPSLGWHLPGETPAGRGAGQRTFFRIRILIRKVERGGDCPPPPLSPTPGPPLAGPILETSLRCCGSAFISCESRSSCSPQFRSGSSCFFSDPDPALKMCKQLLYEEYSEVEKTKKIAQNKTRELVQIYLLIKLHFLPVSISLHFFCFSFKIFPSWIHIPGKRSHVRLCNCVPCKKVPTGTIK